MRIPPWLLGGALAGAACVPRPEMCSHTECGAQASCVAGRCVAQGAVVAIGTARRLVYTPTEVACVRCVEGAGETPAIARLGRTPAAIVLLRFAIDLPPEATIVEGYLDLARVEAAEADPVPLALHAVRIVTPWDERSVTWASMPLLAEVGAPLTRVSAASGPRVRLDVRDLVERWRRRARDEFGVAVVTDGAGRSETGVAFALRPTPASPRASELELYVK
jgi:hypothetical protein